MSACAARCRSPESQAREDGARLRPPRGHAADRDGRLNRVDHTGPLPPRTTCGRAPRRSGGGSGRRRTGPGAPWRPVRAGRPGPRAPCRGSPRQRRRRDTSGTVCGDPSTVPRHLPRQRRRGRRTGNTPATRCRPHGPRQENRWWNPGGRLTRPGAHVSVRRCRCPLAARPPVSSRAGRPGEGRHHIDVHRFERVGQRTAAPPSTRPATTASPRSVVAEPRTRHPQCASHGPRARPTAGQTSATNDAPLTSSAERGRSERTGKRLVMSGAHASDRRRWGLTKTPRPTPSPGAPDRPRCWRACRAP